MVPRFPLFCVTSYWTFEVAHWRVSIQLIFDVPTEYARYYLWHFFWRKEDVRWWSFGIGALCLAFRFQLEGPIRQRQGGK